MKTPLLVAIVVVLHIAAVGAFIFIQGCGTRRLMVEPPPAPIMPPKVQAAAQHPGRSSKPVFQPPSAVERSPSLVAASKELTYVVESGDTLSRVAKKFNVTTRELTELNNIKDAHKIHVGQSIVLPAYARFQAKPYSSSSKSASSRAPAKDVTHVVASGDTLSEIAHDYGATVRAIRSANQLSGDRIVVGQTLFIPGARSKPVAKKAKKKTVPSVAKSLSTAFVTQDNTTLKSASVKSSQPVSRQSSAPRMQSTSRSGFEDPRVTKAASMEPKALSLNMLNSNARSEGPSLGYTVQEGETLEDIAKLFVVRQEDIMTLNQIADPEKLKSGQRIKIPAPDM